MPPPVNRNPIARMKNRILTNKVEREHLSGDIEALEQERQGIIGIMGVSFAGLKTVLWGWMWIGFGIANLLIEPPTRLRRPSSLIASHSFGSHRFANRQVMVEKLNSTDDVIGELANDLATYEAAIAEIQQVGIWTMPFSSVLFCNTIS
jgi:hypothetical protein